MHPYHVAAQHPDRAAIVMASSGTTLTYAELTERAQRIQHLLRRCGLQPGGSLAIFPENVVDYLPVAWAAQSSGLYYTAINSHLTAPEVAYIVNDCGASVIVATEYLAPVASQLTPNLVPNV